MDRLFSNPIRALFASLADDAADTQCEKSSRRRRDAVALGQREQFALIRREDIDPFERQDRDVVMRTGK